MPTRAIGAGLAGGLLAGAAVGAAEAVALWLGAPGVRDLPPVSWAVLVYGAVGAVGGVLAGAVAAALATDAFALAVAGVGPTLAFVAARGRVLHDVLHADAAPASGVGMAVHAGALLACMVAAGWLWWTLRGSSVRARLLTRPLGAAAVVLAATGLWAAAARALAPAPPAPSVPVAALPAAAPHVVLIVVDGLRADALSPYGATRVKTPALDALAADGIVYANAFAQATRTRPSVATIATGLHPASHGVARAADALPDGVTTLAEAMAAAGYRTVGLVTDADVSARFNFQQGFAEFAYLAPAPLLAAPPEAAELALYGPLRRAYERAVARAIDVRRYHQPADVVTARLTAHVERLGQGERLFAYAHYLDPAGVGIARGGGSAPTPAAAARMREDYDRAVAHVDAQLGVLVEALRGRGLYDRTLLVVTADHGEELHERGGWGHGTTLYDEQMRIPLIVKPPRGGASGRTERALVMAVDVAPTVLAAAGLPVVPAMQGHALPVDGAEAPARDAVLAETALGEGALQAIRSPGWKLVTATPGAPAGVPPVQLFDLASDPGETTDVAAGAAVRVEELRAALGRKIVAARARAGMAAEAAVDDTTKDRLKALGYLE